MPQCLPTGAETVKKHDLSKSTFDFTNNFLMQADRAVDNIRWRSQLRFPLCQCYGSELMSWGSFPFHQELFKIKRWSSLCINSISTGPKLIYDHTNDTMPQSGAPRQQLHIRGCSHITSAKIGVRQTPPPLSANVIICLTPPPPSSAFVSFCLTPPPPLRQLSSAFSQHIIWTFF